MSFHIIFKMDNGGDNAQPGRRGDAHY